MGEDKIHFKCCKSRKFGVKYLSMETPESKNKVFHGSNTIVEFPKILQHGFYKDFGYGFYCTNIEKQAKRWALTKAKNTKPIVNVYNYTVDSNLKILAFSKMSEEWLDFVVSCRNGSKHDFDVVEGPMADDTIWNYIEDFIVGDISRVAFWELVKFSYPTHQIVFCTEQALKTISFERSYELRP